jgi:hypothetical protein
LKSFGRFFPREARVIGPTPQDGDAHRIFPHNNDRVIADYGHLHRQYRLQQHDQQPREHDPRCDTDRQSEAIPAFGDCLTHYLRHRQRRWHICGRQFPHGDRHANRQSYLSRVIERVSRPKHFTVELAKPIGDNFLDRSCDVAWIPWHLPQRHMASSFDHENSSSYRPQASSGTFLTL